MTVRIISSMATRALLADLIGMWHDRGGEPVACEAVGGVDAVKRVAAGETFDLAVLAAEAIDRLIASGHVRAGSRTDLVESSVAVAAPVGDVQPSIRDEAALRAAVLAANRVALSTGPSGVAIRALFARWGIAETLHDRLVEAVPGVSVGVLIATGKADLGFQQLSELQGLESIAILGPMPPGLEVVTTFSAGSCRWGADATVVAPLLEFWNSPLTTAVKRRHGMKPVDG